MTRSMPIDRGHSDCDQCRLAVAERECEQLRALVRRLLTEKFMFDVEDDGTGAIGIDGYLSLNAEEVALLQTLDGEGPHPDPWDSCLDVDPFTGQPDHPCGDSCEGGCE